MTENVSEPRITAIIRIEHITNDKLPRPSGMKNIVEMIHTGSAIMFVMARINDSR